QFTSDTRPRLAYRASRSLTGLSVAARLTNSQFSKMIARQPPPSLALASARFRPSMTAPRTWTGNGGKVSPPSAGGIACPSRRLRTTTPEISGFAAPAPPAAAKSATLPPAVRCTSSRWMSRETDIGIADLLIAVPVLGHPGLAGRAWSADPTESAAVETGGGLSLEVRPQILLAANGGIDVTAGGSRARSPQTSIPK